MLAQRLVENGEGPGDRPVDSAGVSFLHLTDAYGAPAQGSTVSSGQSARIRSALAV